MAEKSDDLFDSTWARLRGALFGEPAVNDALQLDADLPEPQIAIVRDQLALCLETCGDLVAARRETAKLGRAYLCLSDVGRQRFMSLLVSEFDTDKEAVLASMEAGRDSLASDNNHVAIQALRHSLAAPYSALLTQFTELPNGVKFLVDMRAEALTYSRNEASLAALAENLRDLFVTWFDIGFLRLTQITWDSPASLLEKLVDYEAVHAIRGWEDLKNRLDSDRRCYAYLHPQIPGEPLIFVEVALTNGLAGNVHELLDETAPLQDINEADTAIFYSISNTQRGLSGISFGNFLIKGVVAELSQEFPELKNFATLSRGCHFN